MPRSATVATPLMGVTHWPLRSAITLMAASLGIVMAGLLTLFMHVLIEFSQQELIDTPRAHMLDFVRIKREEASYRKQDRPERPQSEDAPEAPPTAQNLSQTAGSTALEVSMPESSGEVAVEFTVGVGSGDGEYLPIVKIAPTYPIKAAAEGVEGTCLVEYTVTTSGTTRDVEIVPGRCLLIFARSSIMAAKKFKYKPRIVDGEPVEVPGVRNMFRFVLHNREGQE